MKTKSTIRLLVMLLVLLPVDAGRAETPLSSTEVPTQTEASVPAKPTAEEPADEASQGLMKKAISTEKEKLPWFSSLDQATRDALAKQRPILVRVGEKACVWCRRLELEIDKREVQSELAQWTLVHLDIHQAPRDVQRLSVHGLPALRVLTPRGRLLESMDGYRDAKQLVEWLQKHREAAVEYPDKSLLADGEPSLLEVVRIVRVLKSRDTAVREAAVRRLLPFPDVALAPVVKIFHEGSLASRLSAVELLVVWQAPIDEFDPWRPQTFTEDRLAALDVWVKQSDFVTAAKEETLTDEQIDLAQAQINRIVKVDDTEAAAIRERLSRLGKPLLPLVYAALKEAASDKDRERLLALRYRLVAADTISLRWPGGVERLAATDPSVRHQAAQQLADLSTADDQPLLLELFSDPDPLVRETSLQGLRHSGGKKATEALVALLADPEPNVRAAVLKQLAEDAPKAMRKKVAEYIKTEHDADLIVHAIRYFRVLKGGAKDELLSLLKHESWRVRAEAAEGLGEIASQHSSSSKVTKALAALLDDPDAFVVSRALIALQSTKGLSSVEPLVNAAVNHPSLLPNVVEIISSTTGMSKDAIPHLRKFCAHEQTAVRAAAIVGLCQLASDEVETELAAALIDEASEVRIAASGALLKILQALRPGEETDSEFGFGYSTTLLSKSFTESVFKSLFNIFKKPDVAKPPAVEESPEDETEKPDGKPDEKLAELSVDAKPSSDNSDTNEEEATKEAEENVVDGWLRKFHAGQGQPEWIGKVIPSLEKMLAADTVQERVAAATVLTALGKSEQALPILSAAAEESPTFVVNIASVLPWLVWEDRLTFYRQLLKYSQNDSQRGSLIGSMTEVNDQRSADLLWEELGREETSNQFSQVLHRALRRAYLGDRYYDVSSLSIRKRKRVADQVKPHVEQGTEAERFIALELLLTTMPDDAFVAANKLLEDETLPVGLRRDVFQISLIAQPRAERRRTAIDTLRGKDAREQKIALRFLVFGTSTLMTLKERGTWLMIDSKLLGTDIHARSQSAIEAPRGLKVEHVRPLQDNSDSEIAAYAGYLLALLGEPEGLAPLLTYWHGLKVANDEVTRLVYRAIAFLDDPTHIPILEEIYRDLDEDSMGQFYWTIRIMTGPDILKFRKKIRREVGMEKIGSSDSAF